MNYNNYKKARDKSWEVLIIAGVDELPVSLNKILKEYQISIHKYSENKEYLQKNNLVEYLNHDGFSIGRKIFYQDDVNIQRKRFTISHELGHILLDHMFIGNEIEHQANIFASRILMPMCVLHELNVSTPEQVSNLCNVSIKSAQIRLQRLQLLRDRNKFYLSTLEQRVLENFKNYISYTRPTL